MRRVTVSPYDGLINRAACGLRAHTFVFTDLERLSPAQCERADLLARRVDSVGGRILNRPRRVLRRYDLLKALRAAGRNPFDAFRVHSDRPPPCRFPVFVREEREHTGALSDLLHDHAQLDAALARLRAQGYRPADLLVVEYCDTRGDDGSYRKYSAMRVGEQILPRHILTSRDWVDKYPDIVNDRAAREEADFLSGFPHAADVRAAFDAGGIDYGRIDYSIHPRSGRVVTWEINTNPLIVPPPQECDARRLASQRASAERICDALAALDGPDVRVSVASLPPIGAAGRPRDWGALKSVALCHAPLARRAVRAVRHVLSSSRR